MILCATCGHGEEDHNRYEYASFRCSHDNDGETCRCRRFRPAVLVPADTLERVADQIAALLKGAGHE
jgi:hypothetical protein